METIEKQWKVIENNWTNWKTLEPIDKQWKPSGKPSKKWKTIEKQWYAIENNGKQLLRGVEVSLERPLPLRKYLEVLSQGGGRPSPGLRPPLKGIETASIIRRHENVAVFVPPDKPSCIEHLCKGGWCQQTDANPLRKCPRVLSFGEGASQTHLRPP